jgi:molybdopterin synthase catalytic subunit
MRSAIVEHVIDPTALAAEAAREGNGATVLFLGTVRDTNGGRSVTGIEYCAYRSMAQRELAAIVAEASRDFGTPDVVVEHRVGVLDIGDVSVAITVAHPHRGPAYDASRYVIEQIKRRVPIWKREHYADGTREWVDPTARLAAAEAGGAR